MKPLAGMLPRLRTKARALADRPRAELEPLQRAVVVGLQVFFTCLRKLWRDRAAEMAAALAFQTLFSLLPLLVLALLLLHSVRGLEDAGAQLRNMIVDFLVPGDPVGQGSELVDPLGPDAAPTGGEFDRARQLLRQRIDQRVEQLSQVSFAGIGVAGFLIFLYGATALMRTIESSFDLLYQAEAPRPWSRLPIYFTLLTIGPVALVAAQVLQDRLLLYLVGLVGGWLATVFGWIAPLAASCILLTLALHALPNTTVTWRAAAIGGLWSGLAWFAFQEIFGVYVNRASMTSLYGALALLPFFLLYVYWSWLIILAGVALAFVVQNLDADANWEREPPLPGDPRWLVPIMVRVGEAFTRAESIDTSRLSRDLRLPPRILRPYVRLLEREGYLRSLRDRNDERVLTPAKPLSAITVQEILELAPRARSVVAADVLGELRRGELQAAGGLTLEDVARGYNPTEEIDR